MPKIELKNVTKRWGGFYAVENLNLSIDDASFVTLLGPSGCGKTTLLRMIAGLETPDEGEIWLDDVCVFSGKQKINLPPEKRNLGFVFQDFALWPHMTVFENVAFGLRAPQRICRAECATRCAPYIWRTLKSAILTSCPAVSSSASPLPAPLPFSRGAFCLTNRFPRWMRCSGRKCGTS